MIEYATLEQMRDQIGRHIGDTSSARDTKVDEWINTHYADIGRRFNWSQLQKGSESTLTFTVDEKYLYLPKDCDQLFFLMPDNQSGITLSQAIEHFFNRTNVSKDAAGLVTDWTYAGESSLKAAFSSTAETINVTSSDSTENFDITIHGYTTADDEIIETLSVVAGSGTSVNSYLDIVSFSTDGTNTGTITFAGATSSTTYATISPDDRTAKYKRIRMAQVPTTATAYTLFYKKRLMRLVDNDQIPEIPVSHVLIDMCIATQYSQQRKWDSGARMHFTKAEKALEELWLREVGQGDKRYQAVPMNQNYRRRYGRTYVINNS